MFDKHRNRWETDQMVSVYICPAELWYLGTPGTMCALGSVLYAQAEHDRKDALNALPQNTHTRIYTYICRICVNMSYLHIFFPSCTHARKIFQMKVFG